MGLHMSPLSHRAPGKKEGGRGEGGGRGRGRRTKVDVGPCCFNADVGAVLDHRTIVPLVGLVGGGADHCIGGTRLPSAVSG
jgi:hypothetical protein